MIDIILVIIFVLIAFSYCKLHFDVINLTEGFEGLHKEFDELKKRLK